jgi:hypothetical protein
MSEKEYGRHLSEVVALERMRFRPVCRDCGFRDDATFTRMQLDAYDFACPACPAGGWIDLQREALSSPGVSVQGRKEG